MNKIVNAREAAIVIINKVLREKAYSNIALKQVLEQSGLSRVDKALVTEIVNGTLKNLIKLDYIAGQFVKMNKNKLDKHVEDILRTGIYQIMYLDRIPDSAVCNEGSNLARKYSNEGAVRFVNGVLRNVSRNKDTIKFPDKVKQPLLYLSVVYSHPEWIVEKWLGEYGFEFTEQLLNANNQVPHFTVRINRLKTNKEDLVKVLEQEGIEYSEGIYNKEALYIKGTSAIENKASFQQGLYQIQDESSMLAGLALNPQPGDLVLDVCSAPGGKATHAAELMNNNGKIIARDVYQHKLELIQQSCKRLGITIVETEIFDAKELDRKLVGKVDKVLLDAPCSGLGVLRRKPDLKWKKTPDNFDELAKLQQQMLSKAAEYVKPQGVLVYSTCTINKSENIKVVEAFLKSREDFYLEDLSKLLPENLASDTKTTGYVEIFPNIHGIDGFFISRLRRK
ncbi:MAG: ribosomal small subunit methyltransferase RsmB/transcription antitermination factor NusB [Clostridia bacterium]|jgi:16S rRNA (cytosine967-C5)-methyltransferase|nr:ribosomal small subunit methyltransferase RsmB/transcription antitermination factor NusB [Clostridia bacterium]